MAEYTALVTAANHFLYSNSAPLGAVVKERTFIRVGTFLTRAAAFISKADRNGSVACDRFQWGIIKVRFVGSNDIVQLQAAAFPTLLQAFHITANIDTRSMRVVNYVSMTKAPETRVVVGSIIKEELKYVDHIPVLCHALNCLAERWGPGQTDYTLSALLGGVARAPDVCLWFGDTRQDVFVGTTSSQLTRSMCTCMLDSRIHDDFFETETDEALLNDPGQYSSKNVLPEEVRKLEEIMLAPRKIVEAWREQSSDPLLCYPEHYCYATSVTHPVALSRLMDKNPPDLQRVRDLIGDNRAVHLPSNTFDPADMQYTDLQKVMHAYVAVCSALQPQAEDGSCGYAEVSGLSPEHVAMLAGKAELAYGTTTRLLYVVERMGEDTWMCTTPLIWHYTAMGLLALHAVACNFTPLVTFLTHAQVLQWESSTWDADAHVDRFTLPPSLGVAESGKIPRFQGTLPNVDAIPPDMCSEGIDASLLAHGFYQSPFTIFTGMAGSGKTYACGQICNAMEAMQGVDEETGGRPHVCLSTAYTNTVTNNNRVSGNMRAKTTHKLCVELMGVLPHRLTLRHISRHALEHMPEDIIKLLWVDEAGMYSSEVFAALLAVAYVHPLEHIILSGDIQNQLQPIGMGYPVYDLLRLFPAAVYHFSEHCHRLDPSLEPHERLALWNNALAIAEGRADDVLADQNAYSTFWPIDDLGIIRDELTGSVIYTRALSPIVDRGIQWWHADGPFPMWVCYSRAQCYATNVLCSILYYASPTYFDDPRTVDGALQSIRSATRLDERGAQVVYRPPAAFVGGIVLVRKPGRHQEVRRNARFRLREIFCCAAVRAHADMPWVPLRPSKRTSSSCEESLEEEEDASDDDGEPWIPPNATFLNATAWHPACSAVQKSMAFAARSREGVAGLRHLQQARFVWLETLDERRKSILVCEADLFPFSKTLTQGDACTVYASQGMTIDTVVFLLMGRSAFKAGNRRLVYTAISRASRRMLALAERFAFTSAVERHPDIPPGILARVIYQSQDRDVLETWNHKAECSTLALQAARNTRAEQDRSEIYFVGRSKITV